MAYYPERPIDPPEDDNPECPCCGAECKTVYINSYTGEVMGCDECIHEKDAYDWQDENREVLKYGSF